ncbi:MAG: manganese efflux pump MntP family protein [Dehalococcoidales bacterium]|nr:manganese efflux pump MntP family protein [Dehalococcoidales bacterium]
MGFLAVFLIALGLSADCFAVALSASITNRNITKLQALRVSGFFGFFQALMPLLGWLAGTTIVDLIADYDHWVAFGLLGFVGGKMLWEAFHHEANEKPVDISRGWLLLTLSIATSLDALAVGLAFAFEDVNIWLVIPLIGAVSFIVAGIGFFIGRKVGDVFGKRAEILGGLILIGIGLRILITHLMG